MVSQQPSTFGGHRQCGSGDIFSVFEEHDSPCSHLNPSLVFIHI